MDRIRLFALVAAAVAACALLAPRDAAADVTGKITLTGNAGRPLLRGKAFLDRVENPYTGGKMLDPMPYLVVVLEADNLKLPTPPRVPWLLLGESFDHPLLPVLTGSEVQLQNNGLRAPTLYVDGLPDLMPRTPLEAGGDRTFKVTQTNTLVTVLDDDSANLTGSILPLDTPYFALAQSVPKSAEGKFAIAGVADGTYHLKVWYRTGWLDDVAQDVTVRDGKASADLTLPPGLKIAGAADATKASK